jgi:hypothetical protein
VKKTLFLFKKCNFLRRGAMTHLTDEEAEENEITVFYFARRVTEISLNAQSATPSDTSFGTVTGPCSLRLAL